MAAIYTYARTYPEDWGRGVVVASCIDPVSGAIRERVFDDTSKLMEETGYNIPVDFCASASLAKTLSGGEKSEVVVDISKYEGNEKYNALGMVGTSGWFQEANVLCGVIMRGYRKDEDAILQKLAKANGEGYEHYFTAHPEFYQKYRKYFATEKQADALKKFSVSFGQTLTKSAASTLINDAIVKSLKGRPNSLSVYTDSYKRYYYLVVSECFKTGTSFRYVHTFTADPEHYVHLRNLILSTAANHRQKCGVYSIADNRFMGSDDYCIQLQECCQKYFKENIITVASLMSG